MIGNQYKAHKENVIDLFNRYLEKKGNIDDGVNTKFIKSRVEALKNGKFTLAVAGEVKAGKSAFLNALLGVEILPSDVLQASSAIVEIFKSDTSLLKIKFADEHEEILYNDLSNPNSNEPKEWLHEICKINDKYRDIPSTLIDDYIIKTDDKLIIDDYFIKKLEENSGEALQGRQESIKQYIKERTKDKIPIKIELGYPLKWEFNELRIIDSPGVNATGGVQDISFRFFEEANAILFVHPIKPIESESFRKFVNSVISNRSKETLFLVLTHAGLYSNDEVERLHEEARRLYKDIIPENSILVVDSMLKMIHSDLYSGASVEDIRKSEPKKKILSSYREQAEDEGRKLIDVVWEASRFKKMFDAVNKFSMKAPNLQLQEILEQIKKGYEEQEIQYVDSVGLLEKKKKSPQEFENAINHISDALEKYKLVTKQTKEDLIKNYSGLGSSWQQDINSLKEKYPELITGSTSFESVRKNTIDGLNAAQDKIDCFSKELTQRLGEILEETGKKFSAEHHISIPKVDLNALEQKAKQEAYKDENQFETYHERRWYTLWLKKHEYRRPIGTKKVLDNKKFLDEYKTKCNEEFYKIANALPDKSKEILNTYLDFFEKEMESVISDRQHALEKEKNNKQSNAEIIDEISILNAKKKGYSSRTITVHRSAGESKMISQKIRADVVDEFSSLNKSLQSCLNDNFNVSQTKQFLQTHVPKEIVYKSGILLDTLLNYLMEDARKKIERGDVKLQNAFYDANFRKRINQWSAQLENKFSLEPDVVKYTSDPRLTQGLIASGITFVVGTGITVALTSTTVGAIIAGTVTVLLSAFAFKLAFDSASPKAREIIKLDIDRYLQESQIQILAWLSNVEKSFNDDFHKFCLENGFEPVEE